jgi:conjugal transfer/entry exclusion protein
MRLNKRTLIASFLAGTLLATTPSHAFLGLDGKATLELQFIQLAEATKQLEQAILQVEQGMAMLEHFAINGAADVFTIAGALQNVLRQADNLIAQHGKITGYIDDLYPEEIDRNTSAAAFVELARRQHIEGRKRQIDSANIQAELFAAMEEARVRDRNLMDGSAAAPGVTAAVQATNQLVGGLNNDVRGLQTAMISHHRTVEDRFLREDAAEAAVIARNCKSLARMPASRQPEYCK